jgi:hypothetical protein
MIPFPCFGGMLEMFAPKPLADQQLGFGPVEVGMKCDAERTHRLAPPIGSEEAGIEQTGDDAGVICSDRSHRSKLEVTQDGQSATVSLNRVQVEFRCS